ncbi:hypothetical protein DTO006G1_9695 [Penicillium roqueforti]|uniref:uncharacterized protein n=1 Tax=Penicillium roqueforti TaxID=5082 RepID=UPI001909726E|nr:uncharacterized protein LCP9604111_3002 [Penicillium roqueforti]KAF9250798.1 hypothetical protein LCP9604111_3002 [Penicillium roqueforti]KAI1830864.1 hypothetical protein CBS147337_8221 [Penicillium roqueforti]KAI2751355.1 hypothetical protein DTO006G1_9695 [Penicillium roqueforti]KAI3115907.1 hypothetical protein CBS147333_517 [Penicillium roqueforti]KAI3175581.1 hypothetical protein DTO039G3_2739 [Penicillium roqueforti]
MQSIRQHRVLRRKLQQQFVTKHEKPDNVWTHEGRYEYRGGEIHTEPGEPNDDPAAGRRREHGHRTFISGPSLNPRHSVRSHIEREGDIEGSEYDPVLSTDPHTINTQETLGNTPDIMVTGVERPRPCDSTGSETDIESLKKNELIIVTFEGECDIMDPHNWSFKCRLFTTILTSLTGCVVFWSSTIDSTALMTTKQLYHTTFEVETLPTAMFLIGCGRVVCRGLAGLFGSAPAIVSAASLVDVWSRIERVYTFPIFAIFIFTGPLVAPTPGAFAVSSDAVSWRWVDWMTIIFAGVLLIPVVLFLPETYSPILLYWKAKELRRLTGDDRYRSPIEFRKSTFTQRMSTSLYRPLQLLATEPIIMIHSIYVALLFMILYTFIAGFVSIYEMTSGFSPAATDVAFLAIEVGVLLSVLAVPISMWLVRRDIYHSRANGEQRPDPEISLYMGMFGAPAVPISLFWMGWTARHGVSYWSPLVASGFFGFGSLCIFVSAYQYVADSYESYSASALASLQMLRLVAAGAMAIVAEIMYKELGIEWTLTLWGGVSLLFLPVPYLLYWKGYKIRAQSRYARRSERS